MLVNSFIEEPAGIDAFVSLLLHCDGIDGSTSFPDSGPLGIVTNVGNDPQVDTAQIRFGSGSAFFSGSDFIFMTGSTTPFVFGTGDFTIDLWIRLYSGGAVQIFADMRPNGISGLYPTLRINASDILEYFTDSAVRITGTTVLSLNTWYYVMLSRAGGITRLFLNGIQEGSDYVDANDYLCGSGRPLFGCSSGSVGSDPLAGWLDEIRVSKGIARKSAAFTPPLKAYSTSPVVLFTADDDINENSPLLGWHNIVTATNVSANPIGDLSYPASNMANPLTAYEWRGDLAGGTVTIDVAAYEGELNYVAICRHNFGTLGVNVWVNVDTGAGYVEATDPVIFTDDSPVLFRLPTLDNYVSIQLEFDAPYDVPRIAVIYVGKLTIVQRRLYVGHSPITLNRDTQIVNGMSEGGNFLGNIMTGQTTGTGVALRNLTPNWYRNEFDSLLQNNRTLPFFFLWRPATYPAEIGYAWLANDPKPSNMRANGMMQVDLTLRGVLR